MQPTFLFVTVRHRLFFSGITGKVLVGKQDKSIDRYYVNL